MEAIICITVYCPKCGLPMERNRNKDVTCKNQRCLLFNTLFKAPTVKLKSYNQSLNWIKRILHLFTS
jgi:hypothetical protein